MSPANGPSSVFALPGFQQQWPRLAPLLYENLYALDLLDMKQAGFRLLHCSFPGLFLGLSFSRNSRSQVSMRWAQSLLLGGKCTWEEGAFIATTRDTVSVLTTLMVMSSAASPL